MLAEAMSCVLWGLEATVVRVEVDLANGLPCFEIVGLPDAAVRESRERVRAAVRNAGLEFPLRRITVNLTPADLRKGGSHLDLPIAVAVLAASGQVPPARCREHLFLGALSLDGAVGSVPAVLPLALGGRRAGLRGVVVPAANAREALLAGGLAVVPVNHLREVVAWLRGAPPPVAPAREEEAGPPAPGAEPVDLGAVRGQELARPAVEAAAAGGHHLLLVGPPGTGKTMLARALPGILPPLTPDEAIEVTAIYSAAGLLPPGSGLVTARPFRAPHHTSSATALVGGGPRLRPGEVTLAHRGVLFLDEATEFARDTLESLRQPLEDGRVCVARARGAALYPARFILVLAANPCPCGAYGDGSQACGCPPPVVRRYRSRLSGPLLDRVDMQVWVRRPPVQAVLGAEEEPSAVVRERVAAARERQRRRYRGEGVTCNAELAPAQVRRFCRLDPDLEAFLEDVGRRHGLSPRRLLRAVRVARTLADLAGDERIGATHLAQALTWRSWEQGAAKAGAGPVPVP